MLVATVTACSRPAWAMMAASLACCFGVEDLVRDAALGEHLRQHLGFLHRGSAHQYGLALFVTLGHVVHHSGELCPSRSGKSGPGSPGAPSAQLVGMGTTWIL